MPTRRPERPPPYALDRRTLEREVVVEVFRASGPGGQHVNKVETRVDLLFSIPASRALNEAQKERLLDALKARIDSAGTLRITAQTSRSQWQNRQEAVTKFAALVGAALKQHRKRIATSPTRASRERRMTAKNRRSDMKRLRGKVRPE